MKRHRLIVTLVLGMLLALTACTGQTALVFENQTACGAIDVELSNPQDNTAERYEVRQGERLAVSITPNVTYDYYVNYRGEGSICNGEYRGQVTVPSGSTQTFNLTAVTPTPRP